MQTLGRKHLANLWAHRVSNRIVVATLEEDYTPNPTDDYADDVTGDAARNIADDVSENATDGAIEETAQLAELVTERLVRPML